MLYFNSILYVIKFHELLGFWDFWGMLEIKVKMQYLVQCTRTRVARKSFSVMVCMGLHGFALDPPSIKRNWSNKSFRKMETVGNGRKRSETMGNSWKHDQAKTCPTRSIFKIQCKPMQTMTLKLFRATLVRVHCTKYCILTLISNIPQKSPNPRSS